MRRSTSAFWVSAVLAAAVLGTFYTSQWKGPVGTLQHFIAAVRSDDQRTIDRLTYPPGVHITSDQLPGYAHTLNIHFAKSRRVGDRFYQLVWVLLSTPEGQAIEQGVIWVLVKTPDGWKVDIQHTNAANTRMSQ